jgi:hypothetical protein
MVGHVVGAVAAAVVNAIGESGSNGGGDVPPPPPRPESPCEAQLHEWQDLHDADAKVPPQLRCAANGDWPRDPTAAR